MKEILKVMRFDFLTAKPVVLSSLLITSALIVVLGMLFSPIVAAYLTFLPMLLVIPLHSVEGKSELHLLYGILPVQRKSITRARFIYIFLIHFLMQLAELILIAASSVLRLHRFLPGQDSKLMRFVQESFENLTLPLFLVFGLTLLFCLLFSYMEMMGQIFGRENEFKTILISLGVITLLGFAFDILASHEILPAITLPSLPSSVGGAVLLGAALDVVLCGICLLFGEITASRLAKREL